MPRWSPRTERRLSRRPPLDVLDGPYRPGRESGHRLRKVTPLGIATRRPLADTQELRDFGQAGQAEPFHRE